MLPCRTPTLIRTRRAPRAGLGLERLAACDGFLNLGDRPKNLIARSGIGLGRAPRGEFLAMLEEIERQGNMLRLDMRPAASKTQGIDGELQIRVHRLLRGELSIGLVIDNLEAVSDLVDAVNSAGEHVRV